MTPYSPAYWQAADRPPVLRPMVRAWRLHVAHRLGKLVGGAAVGVVVLGVALVVFRWALYA